MPLDLRTSKIVEQLESTKGAEILNFPFLENFEIWISSSTITKIGKRRS